MTFEDRLEKWKRIEVLFFVFVLLTVLLPTFLWWVGILPVVFPEWLQLLLFGTWFLSSGIHTCFKPIPFGTEVEAVAKKKRKLLAACYIPGGLIGLALSLVKFLELKPLA